MERCASICFFHVRGPAQDDEKNIEIEFVLNIYIKGGISEIKALEASISISPSN